MGCCSSKRREDVPQPKLAERHFLDRYETIEEVQRDLRAAGLESSQLIIAIDYTKSNTWTGARSFGGRCLHDIAAGTMNPYQSVISIVGRTLAPFDDDHVIPVYGFGDTSTGGRGAFPFYSDRYCYGFEEVLRRYNEITPMIKLSGPTNFAPAIREAITIVRTTRAYHILVIIADGQVDHDLETQRAIVDASHWPLSIVVVGVGDGPWTQMEHYDDCIRGRQFDNFQFVNYSKTISGDAYSESNAAAFAMAALMEVPRQYLAIKRLGMLA